MVGGPYFMKKYMQYTSYPIVFITLVFCLAVLSACISSTDKRGYTLDKESLATIKTGKSTKRDVIKALGSPSTMSRLGDETWYYISSKRKQMAFLKPKIEEQRVDVITFDTDGNVKSLRVYTEADLRDVQFSKDFTPTAGNELGIAEQLLGNIGRFEGAGRNSPTPRGP